MDEERVELFVYAFEHRISHAEVDFLGEQKLSALLGLFERAAVEASAAAGFDARRYQAAGRVWLIRRTRVCRFLPVGGTDMLQVSTRIADVRRVRSLREYRVTCRGHLVAEGATDWVYCDLASRLPTRIPQELAGALAGGRLPPSHERAPSPPEQGSGAPQRCERVVRSSHLDHVWHVNNAMYADFLEDAACAWLASRGWTLQAMAERGGALRPILLDVEYVSDAGVDERLDIATWGEAPAVCPPTDLPRELVFVQNIRGPDGRLIVRSQSFWTWRCRSPILGTPPM